MGRTNSCMTTWKDSTCCMRLAASTPIEVSRAAHMAIKNSNSRINAGRHGTWASGATANMITPWKVATVAPRRVFTRNRPSRPRGGRPDDGDTHS